MDKKIYSSEESQAFTRMFYNEMGVEANNRHIANVFRGEEQFQEGMSIKNIATANQWYDLIRNYIFGNYSASVRNFITNFGTISAIIIGFLSILNLIGAIIRVILDFIKNFANYGVSWRLFYGILNAILMISFQYSRNSNNNSNQVNVTQNPRDEIIEMENQNIENLKEPSNTSTTNSNLVKNAKKKKTQQSEHPKLSMYPQLTLKA